MVRHKRKYSLLIYIIKPFTLLVHALKIPMLSTAWKVFWPVFSGIRTEYREKRDTETSQYSVRMRENKDEKNAKVFSFYPVIAY